MARKQKAAEPLPTVWHASDELWAEVSKVLEVHDPPANYGPDRIEAAARRGNDIGATTYGSIKSILQNGLDRAHAPTDATDAAPIQHANIRGRGYYH